MDHVRHYVPKEIKHYDTIDHFNSEICLEARISASKQFLKEELGFADKELDSISYARLSPSSKANIMWITASENLVRRIRMLSARVKNKDITLLTFFPSILWDRRTALMNNCKKAHRLNPKLRYQIRLGTTDIELWTKNFDEIQYLRTPLLEFGSLPPIEIHEFQPIEERTIQGGKRQRSESPQLVQNKRFNENLDGTLQEESLLNSAMDQQETSQETSVSQNKDSFDYTL